MKVLVCYNQEKHKSKYCLDVLVSYLEKKGVEYSVIEKNDNEPNDKFNALFVIGGDGTILRRTKYANTNSIPIIGINAGKLGFLTEFEISEIEESVDLFLKNGLKEDPRLTISCIYNGKKYFALNDIVVQRVYRESRSMIINLDVKVNDKVIEKIVGDGVILSSPTGSTAYSLSLGGSVFCPDVEAFVYTPIAPHSFSDRPIVYSPKNTSKIVYNGGNGAGLFVDGKLVGLLNNNDEILIESCENKTIFLRKKDFDFFKRLANKIKGREE